MKQSISSAKTSMRQVAAGFKKVDWKPHTTNLDFGGGKYDDATKFLKKKKVANYVFDPYNRTSDENLVALECKPNTITCFNVLNVIKEDGIIDDILKHLWVYGKPVYFSVYVGNGTGKGRETCNGYQRNQKLKDYVPLIEKYFVVERKGILLIATPK